MRYSAAFALGSAGEAAATAVPALESKLQSADPFEAAVAAWALVKVAPSAERSRAAVPRLIAVLDHGSPAVRVETARTLGEIAAGDSAAVAALEAAVAAERVDEVRVILEQALRSALADGR